MSNAALEYNSNKSIMDKKLDIVYEEMQKLAEQYNKNPKSIELAHNDDLGDLDA
jgi:hypothetical protein